MIERKKGSLSDFAVFVAIVAVVFSLISSISKNTVKVTAAGLKIPAAVGYVNDFAGVMSSQNKDSLDFYLKELDKKTSAEVAVVTLPSLKGNAIEDVSLEIGRKWGIGKKGKDNGLLILVATGDKKMRIEVGYGLEGVITDGKAGRIRDGYMIPYFKQGNMEKGIVDGTVAVASEIAKSYNVQMPSEFNAYASSLLSEHSNYSSSSSHSRTTGSSGMDIFVFLIFIIIFILLPRRGLFVGGYTDYGGGFGGSSGSGFGGFGGGSFGGGGASGGW